MVPRMQRFALAAACGAVLLFASPVSAQKAPAEGSGKAKSAVPEPEITTLPPSGAWSAYVSPEKTGQICYIAGRPAKSEPATAKRGPIHLLVTHNTADKTSNVVSFVAGYAFKDGSEAELDIGGRKFSLFTKDDTAWARDAATDKAIVEAMQKGREAVIKGSSGRGTATTDTYALEGFSQVLGEIDKACKVKRS